MRHLRNAVVGIGLLILLLRTNLSLGQTIQLPPSQDAVATGNDLLHSCTPMIRLFDGGLQLTRDELTPGFLCLGYIAGFIDGYNIGTETEKSQTGLSHPAFCLPAKEPLPASQALRIVVKWLNDHPERLQQPKQVLITLAFKETFPCK